MKQKGFAIIVVLIVILGIAGYFIYKNYYQTTPPQACTLEAKICPDGSSVGRTGPNCEFAACPEVTAGPKTGATTGTVTGKLCYPSSFLPPGEIVAKKTDSGKTYTQTYEGTFNGGGQTYSFELPVGSYHMRYQAHASTKETSIFTSGYYDECAKTMHTNECTPDSGHVHIPVTVTANEETTNIDLCDFYYNPTQEKSLSDSF